MSLNNEVGTLNLTAVLVAATKAFDERILFHSDISQCVGKVLVCVNMACRITSAWRAVGDVVEKLPSMTIYLVCP